MSQRYVVHLPLDVGDDTARFVGTDVTTGQTVVMAFVCVESSNLKSPAIGVVQRHLAAVAHAVDAPDLVAFPDSGQTLPNLPVLVAELVRGRTLAKLLRREPMNIDRAVAWTIRILEGLDALHRRGVSHGGLSSHAIVAEPKGRPIAPVISQLIVPPLTQYASPERLTGEGPSVLDDLWAVGLLLYEMLTGKPPFKVGSTAWGQCEFDELETERLRSLPHGVELESILRRALSTARGQRPASADEFTQLLDAWERRVVLPSSAGRVLMRVAASSKKSGLPAAWDQLSDGFDGGGERVEATLDAAEQLRRSILSDREPSVTGSTLSTGGERRRTKSFGSELAAFRQRSKPRFGKRLGWGIGALAIVALGAYLGTTRKDPPSLTSSTGTLPAAYVVAPSSSTAERPHLPMAEERSRCIQSYFRPDTLNEGAELGFVCTDEDFLSVTKRLNEDAMLPVASAAVGANGAIGSAAGAASESGVVATAPSMVIRSGASGKGWQLGWYELVATAIIRQNCCREAAPIKLPESSGWCQQLQSVVRRIAADSVKVGDISPGVRVFDEAITCLMAQGRHIVYPYKAVPTSLQKSNFQQFLKHAAEIDARRAARR